MRRIEELSKNELLGLISHNLPKSLWRDHPCECALCGTHPNDMPIQFDETHIVYAMFYICDKCTKAMDDFEDRCTGEGY